MAEKRMFAKTIIDSDAFLEMPVTSQLLYFHLSMRADDEGFINKPKAVMKMVGANGDDLKILFMKKFVIPFDSGVVVIKHWRINNYIRKDMFHETTYKEERALLGLDENNAYTLTVTSPLQVCNETETQIRLDKNRLDKNRLESEELKEKDKTKETNKKNKYGEYKHVLLTEEQHTNLIRDFGEEYVNEYITKIDEYIQLKGKPYKDYNLAIRNWLKNDGKTKPKEKKARYEGW